MTEPSTQSLPLCLACGRFYCTAKQAKNLASTHFVDRCTYAGSCRRWPISGKR